MTDNSRFIPPHFRIDARPNADPAAIVRGPGVRFTVLTSRLIRMEHSPSESFEDRPSQIFWHRAQPIPAFETGRKADEITITTEHLRLRYHVNPKGFTWHSLSVELRKTGTRWRYGDRDPLNLRGTARTLDGADGAVPLSQGLMSRSGWAIVDDSETFVFDEQDWLAPRERPGSLDLYFFGYGDAYLECLRDFCQVAGPVPLVPRWALGNWWSRYWAYSQAELTQLMQDFRSHEVPLSVCIIDMDWHITQTGNESTGWTGYTWNRELFPDPPALLQWLHRQGLKVGLNLHPAEGIHPHEAAYGEMARRMSIDPASGEPVPFDIADPRFVTAYFDVLHHPMEAQGVDFWWLDWQQGVKVPHTARPKLANLDPLFWLNHLHFYDLARDGTRRPFIFSRWPGLGSRYAIGFSGDSVVSWQSLAFQPYFTATAANVAFPWWSHDIGGHMHGVEDGELYARWVQLGVFSPILRLHSTNNPYHERRPWGYDGLVLRAARAALQLRHALVPYIYSMAWWTATESRPLVLPMYYLHAAIEDAYRCPGQFCFGSELIIAPYVASRDPDTRLSHQTVWLPDGDWYDFFTGDRYRGGGWRSFCGGLDEIPVLARAGAIVPLASQSARNGVDNPAELTVVVFPGADNAFRLYEDDGTSQAYQDGASCLTPMGQAWGSDRLVFTIGPAAGDTAVVPAERTYRLLFRGVARADDVRLEVNGQARAATPTYDDATETLSLGPVTVGPTSTLIVTLAARVGDLRAGRDRRGEKCRALLRTFRLETGIKAEIDGALDEILAGRLSLRAFAPWLTDSQLAALAQAIE